MVQLPSRGIGGGWIGVDDLKAMLKHHISSLDVKLATEVVPGGNDIVDGARGEGDRNSQRVDRVLNNLGPVCWVQVLGVGSSGNLKSTGKRRGRVVSNG